VQRFVTVVLVGVTLATVALLAKWHALRHGYDLTATSSGIWVFLYGAGLCAAAYAVGLPDLPRSRRARWATSLAAIAVVALVFSGIQLVLGSLLLPRLVIFGAAAVLVPVYTLLANLSSDGRRRGAERERVFLIGSADVAADLVFELDREPERYARLVGTLPADEIGPGRLAQEIGRAAATVIVLDRLAQINEAVVGQVAKLHLTGLRVRTLTLFYEEWLGKLPVSELEQVSLLFDIGELHRIRYGRAKRLVDLGVGAAGAVALAACVPLVFIGNLVANRGPMWFTQPRVGRGGQTFSIIKFRTMRPVAGDGRWTELDDPRVTSFGRWLRRTHLDELPQVLNILRGDLSIVGPRPEQPRYVEELRHKLPFYELRHLVRPGLTGWAQVKFPYAADEVDAREKLQYEFFYLRRQSISLDVRILVRTLRAVTRGRGR
jgi:lipopolysaccharide/colanic/teichoic acid biosynthesis glycosyltransferase